MLIFHEADCPPDARLLLLICQESRRQCRESNYDCDGRDGTLCQGTPHSWALYASHVTGLGYCLFAELIGESDACRGWLHSWPAPSVLGI